MEVILLIIIVLGSFLLLFGICCIIFGFRTFGIAARSCASCCQSIIGNVVKGSCFAIMTSLGMRGCFILIIILGLLMLIFVCIYYVISSPWFTNFCDWIDDDFWHSILDFICNIGNFFHNLWTSISDFITDIGNFFHNLWTSISDFISNIGNFFHLAINSNKVAKKFLQK